MKTLQNKNYQIKNRSTFVQGGKLLLKTNNKQKQILKALEIK